VSRVYSSETRELPGDLALWFFLCAELAVFGLLIIGFCLVRLQYPEMFYHGLQQLHMAAGIANTLVLLSGSYFLVLAVERVRHTDTSPGGYFFAAAACGMIYIIIKISEYQQLYADGYSLHYDIFFGFYFFTTFFHLLHVLAGVVLLLLTQAWLKKKKNDQLSRRKGAESVAYYWHMVDLVWIVLFPTLYVLS